MPTGPRLYDMDVVRRYPEGSLAFQWHQVDKVYDALLSLGLHPFVELNPMPGVMASGPQTICSACEESVSISAERVPSRGGATP
ncbi:MAG: hypothetical protein JJU29_09630 [Verrucomicrobia bacterium]|nr:hypothetical protein [Verrucomicrobiota bacterium]MCH8513112.1 hypothetical protein [Kiritimatiellia bacterium]